MNTTQTVTLFQPPNPNWGRIPNMSPFCVKLETYLRAANIPYQVKPGSPVNAPKGKIPYAKIGDRMMGDSGLIIEYLKSIYGDKLDAHLSAEDKAVGHAFRRMIEEHSYFALAHTRWSEPQSFAYVEAFFRQFLPKFLGGFIIKKIRKDFLKKIHGQGMGRHAPPEILALAKQDLNAIEQFLKDKHFVFGSQLSSYDCTFFGFLIHILWVPWDSEAKKYALTLPHCNAYVERVWNAVWA